MKGDIHEARTMSVIGAAILSSLLLLGLLPVLPAAQIVGGNTESNAKGKVAAKADFVLTVKGRPYLSEGYGCFIKRDSRRDRAEDQY